MIKTKNYPPFLAPRLLTPFSPGLGWPSRFSPKKSHPGPQRGTWGGGPLSLAAGGPFGRTLQRTHYRLFTLNSILPGLRGEQAVRGEPM